MSLQRLLLLPEAEKGMRNVWPTRKQGVFRWQPKGRVSFAWPWPGKDSCQRWVGMSSWRDCRGGLHSCCLRGMLEARGRSRQELLSQEEWTGNSRPISFTEDDNTSPSFGEDHFGGEAQCYGTVFGSFFKGLKDQKSSSPRDLFDEIGGFLGHLSHLGDGTRGRKMCGRDSYLTDRRP